MISNFLFPNTINKKLPFQYVIILTLHPKTNHKHPFQKPSGLQPSRSLDHRIHLRQGSRSVNVRPYRHPLQPMWQPRAMGTPLHPWHMGGPREVPGVPVDGEPHRFLLCSLIFMSNIPSFFMKCPWSQVFVLQVFISFNKMHHMADTALVPPLTR